MTKLPRPSLRAGGSVPGNPTSTGSTGESVLQVGQRPQARATVHPVLGKSPGAFPQLPHPAEDADLPSSPRELAECCFLARSLPQPRPQQKPQHAPSHHQGQQADPLQTSESDKGQTSEDRKEGPGFVSECTLFFKILNYKYMVHDCKKAYSL